MKIFERIFLAFAPWHYASDSANGFTVTIGYKIIFGKTYILKEEITHDRTDRGQVQ